MYHPLTRRIARRIWQMIGGYTADNNGTAMAMTTGFPSPEPSTHPSCHLQSRHRYPHQRTDSQLAMTTNRTMAALAASAASLWTAICIRYYATKGEATPSTDGYAPERVSNKPHHLPSSTTRKPSPAQPYIYPP